MLVTMTTGCDQHQQSGVRWHGWSWRVLWWMMVLEVVQSVHAGVSALDTKQCGDLRCDRTQYCSSVDNICRNCRDICAQTSYNFQQITCEEQCQDYLHDQRYSSGQLERVQLISTLSLIFSLLALVGLVAGAACFFYKKINLLSLLNKKKSKSAEITRKSLEISTITLPSSNTTLDIGETDQATSHNPRTPQTEYTNLSTFKNHHARERSPDNTSPPTPQSAYTTTSGRHIAPLAKRHPSEDSTLDYAYDNPGLAPSPVMQNGISTVGTTI